MPVKMILKKGQVPVKIYTEEVESSALDQLEDISQLPIIHSHVAAMPDVHTGIGATVGAVIPTKGAVIPSAVGVDIGCFIGQTQVSLWQGPARSLKELAQQGGEHDVYALDTHYKTFKAKATAQLTRRQAALVRVTLDQHKEVICTPDHPFMLHDGTWCRAEHLRPHTTLMSSREEMGKNARQVTTVEDLSHQEEVYCLTVPHYENFALEAGIFVHNCGMNALRLSLPAHQLPETLKPIRLAIEEAIPVGFDMHKSAVVESSTLKTLDRGLEKILDRHPAIGKMLKKIHETWTQQLGSLGGGNHFIEICLDEHQEVWVMLHSGSRGIGNTIGRYFIELAKKDMEKLMVQLPHRDLAYLKEGTQYFDDYVEAVQWAQDYAMCNRREMMKLILQTLRKHFPHFEVTKEAINCHHNYVSIEEHFGEKVYLTRKGAISAREGELGIIPGSMGTKSYIVRGKGNPESFCSCAHGAGRRMSRTAAKKSFNHRDMEKQTEGIECRKDAGVIDEIPQAYKDIDEVMENQKDLVEIVHTLKQVLCVKG